MTVTKVGFIGTRDVSSVSKDRLSELDNLVHTHGRDRCLISTGAAHGVDQYVGTIAIESGYSLALYLPWKSYEEQWVTQTHGMNGVRVEVYSPKLHPEALNSVYENHPNPSALTVGAIALHARNYLIVKDCSLVVAVPKFSNGRPVGGTAQGIRLCKSMGIEVMVI